MKRIALVLAASVWAAHAAAAGPSCAAQVEEKKLAGAAKTSFMKKCEADAKAACEASAQDQKLAGAARASFLKKCAADATGGK
jgi:hypothetical protein